jgi:hypothetical protein
MTTPDITKFDEIRNSVLISEHERKSIGTLGERTLHLILKLLYEPSPEFREQKVGRYIADIKRESEIVEIQTRAFSSLRAKLTDFLPAYRVKVVFPIAHTKYISWIDPDTGEIISRRKSPKQNSVNDFLLELYALRPILPLDGLSFDLVYLDIEEFKLLCGRSRDRKKFGAKRCERIPTAIGDIITLEFPIDFLTFVPDSLGDEFTRAEFAKAAKLNSNIANRVLQTLVTLGTLERAGKIKNSYIYKRKG